MKPIFAQGHVRADCPDCGVPTTFEFQSGGAEFGTISRRTGTGDPFVHKLLRCAVCHRAGVATVALTNNYVNGTLSFFWPRGLPHQPLPPGAPRALALEMLEAEKCMSVAAWRAAAALLRSALEKTLKGNGYDESNLKKKIDAAAADGTITASRQRRAQELIRTLGNDVLHDEWREVSEEEVTQAHDYAARVIHDFYDDRDTVVGLLQQKGRLPPT